MSYYKKSDVKNHLSTGAVWPPTSLSQRTEAAASQEDNSPDVKPATAEVIPFHPIAKGSSSQAQVGGEVGVPSGASRPKRSRL